MHLLPWLYMSVNLGLLPGLAMVPIQKPEINTKTYETHLFLEMVGNWEKEHEQETVEETAEAVITEETEAVTEEVHEPETVGIPSEVPTEAPVPTTVESRQDPEAQPTPLYSVNGAILGEDIQEYLYRRLSEAGIEWFMPYAILIAYQESTFDIYAVNQKNGIDKGLFQFRSTYWGAGDIFNPYTQIDVFVGLMANRANNLGCTVSDMISRHNQSDYGQYCQSYVDAVMGWAGSLVQVR